MLMHPDFIQWSGDEPGEDPAYRDTELDEDQVPLEDPRFWPEANEALWLDAAGTHVCGPGDPLDGSGVCTTCGRTLHPFVLRRTTP